MSKKEIKRYLFMGAVVIGVMLVIKNFSYIGGFISLLWSSVCSLVIGCAVAYVLNIPMSFLERHYFPKKNNKFVKYSRRPVCLIILILLVFAVIFLVMKLVIPEVIASCKVLYSTLPETFEKVRNWAIKTFENIPDIQQKIYELDIDWQSIASNIVKFLSSGATGFISSLAGFIGSFTMSITKIVVAVIFAMYILIGKDGIKLGFSRLKKAYMSEKSAEKVQHILNVINQTFKSFFVGQFTEAIILGILCAIGMLILGLPYAVMTGTVVGVTALVPIVGAFIGAAVGAFMILTINPMQAVIFIIFLIILQQIEENFIYPRVVGSSVGLPGIWVLAAVTVGGSMFGIMGMLLGVPAFAAVYKLVYENLEKREREKDTPNPPAPDENNSEQNNNNNNNK